MDTSSATPFKRAHFGRYVLIGFFTVAPLWVTWLVFDFLLGLLANAGLPVLKAAAAALRPVSDLIADGLLDPSFQTLLGVLVTLSGLYLVGLGASMVVGRRLIAWMEHWLERLPLVHTIYRGTKRFLQTLRQGPVAGQRVVLIAFPTPTMRAVGFVTKIFRDQGSGRQLAAVYVPTSPNPTSGYIEIVPLEDVVYTDWSMEEAMSFVVTGGTNAPDSVRYTNPAPATPAEGTAAASGGSQR